MLLARVTSQLLRAIPWAAGRPGAGALGRPACRPSRTPQPAGPRRAAFLSGPTPPRLEDSLVPRRMAISPLESWLSARFLWPGPHAGIPEAACPPERAGQWGDGAPDAPAVRCRNVLKIRRRKMNHHKYRKLVKRTRFLRRKVREGRLRRKQARFERDLKRIWLKAGLKDAPEGWQTPKIYLKNK